MVCCHADCICLSYSQCLSAGLNFVHFLMLFIKLVPCSVLPSSLLLCVLFSSFQDKISLF